VGLAADMPPVSNFSIPSSRLPQWTGDGNMGGNNWGYSGSGGGSSSYTGSYGGHGGGGGGGSTGGWNNGSSGGGSRASQVAANIIGSAEMGYNMTLDASLNASNFAKGLGVGLTGLSIVADGIVLHNQYKNEGNVELVTAINISSSTTGVISKLLSWTPYGGRIAPFMGNVAGFVGMAISIGQSWWAIYNSMNELRYAPCAINKKTGEPYYSIYPEDYDEIRNHIGNW
jgi:hypothetical protein